MSKDIFYKNCSEIPIFNFFELVKTRDLKLLVKNKYKKEVVDEEEGYSRLMSLLVEYNSLTDNSDLLKEYKAQFDIEYMESRYNITKKIISMYLDSGDIAFLLLLKDMKWAFDFNKNAITQIKAINKTLIGLKNKINIAKINFVNRFRKKNREDNPNFNLRAEIINLEVSLPINYKVDIYKDSIADFVYWRKALETKIKALQNGQVKP